MSLNLIPDTNARIVSVGVYPAATKPTTQHVFPAPNHLTGQLLPANGYLDFVARFKLSGGAEVGGPERIAKANVPFAFFKSASAPNSGRDNNTVSLAYDVLDWRALVGHPATAHESHAIRHFMSGDAEAQTRGVAWLTEWFLKLFVGFEGGPEALITPLLPPTDAAGNVIGEAKSVALNYVANEGVGVHAGKVFLEVKSFLQLVTATPAAIGMCTSVEL